MEWDAERFWLVVVSGLALLAFLERQRGWSVLVVPRVALRDGVVLSGVRLWGVVNKVAAGCEVWVFEVETGVRSAGEGE